MRPSCNKQQKMAQIKKFPNFRPKLPLSSSCTLYYCTVHTVWNYLVFGSGSNPILVCDQLDQFGLVKKYCFVQRCSSILVSRQGQSFRCQQFSYHRYHSSSGSIMQNAYGILHIEKRFWIFGLGLFENNSIEFFGV